MVASAAAEEQFIIGCRLTWTS